MRPSTIDQPTMDELLCLKLDDEKERKDGQHLWKSSSLYSPQMSHPRKRGPECISFIH